MNIQRWIPIPNLISNQNFLDGGVLALLEWDETLFDGFTVPAELDKEIAIDTILTLHGLTPLMRPDPAILKRHIASWSKRKQKIWKKMYDSTVQEYNMIENYDRFEDSTDTRTVDTKETSTGTIEGTTSENANRNEQNTNTETPNLTTENKVSAENVDTYQPESQSTQSGTNKNVEDRTLTDTNSSEMNQNNNGTRDENVLDDFTHTARVHGNIGVTTAPQMIEEFRRVENFDIYVYIADEFKEEFCLKVY